MTADREALVAEVAGVLAESIGAELYVSLMEASTNQWRLWEYMTDAAKEKYRAEGARIVAEAVTPALADLLAAREQQARAEALASAAFDIAHTKGGEILGRYDAMRWLTARAAEQEADA